MTDQVGNRGLIVAVRRALHAAIAGVLQTFELSGWEVFRAESCVQLRSLLQKRSCNLLLLDQSLSAEQGWEWLNLPDSPATVVLMDNEAEAGPLAQDDGATFCLPLATVERPALLLAALRRAAKTKHLICGQIRLERNARECQRNLNDLVARLMRVTSLNLEKRWYAQRDMLLRLEEETHRAKRHGCPLAIAVGDFRISGPLPDTLDSWAVEQISSLKRRCDVAGDFGLRAFLLILPHTPREGGAACCRRLQRVIEAGAPPGEACSVHAYFGIAALSDDNNLPITLLREAEEHLTLAHAGGGCRLVANGGGSLAG
jgi:GGDEF domain-containing protein